MRWFWMGGCAVVMAVALTGCDWTSSGGDGSWNSRYDRVNFSGVYRGWGGEAVAVGLATTPGGTLVANQQVATADGSSSAYAGNLSNTPVVPGSATFSTSGYTFSDDGNQNLVGSVPFSSGTIQYASGAWTLNFGPSTPAAGNPINASYSYTVEAAGAQTVRTLNVTQTGQKLSILASNGVLFEGQIGGMNATGGSSSDTQHIVAEFTATGEAGGVRQRLVGTMSSMLRVDSEEQDTFTGAMDTRILSATWIVDRGDSYDVFGVASPVMISEEQSIGGGGAP